MFSYFKGHRTQIIARILMVLGLLHQYAGQMFPPEMSGFVLFGAALAMEIMRWFTTTPVMKSV